MAVLRDYAPEETKSESLTPLFQSDLNESVSSKNTLLLGATLRTATGFGRSATVKAGEDIRPALNSLKSAGGGTLILLAGTHKVTYDIVGGDKINIIGEGTNQTVIDFQATTSAITYDLNSDFYIAHLTVTNSSNVLGAFVLKSCGRFQIDFVTSEANNVAAGFYLTSCYSYSMRDCTSHGNIGSGFHFNAENYGHQDHDTFTVDNCRSTSNGAHGFRLTASTSFFAWSFINCYSASNTLDGYSLETDLILDGGLTNCSAAGNDGWDFDIFAQRVSVIGCHSSTGVDFIRTNASCSGIIILGCVGAGDYNIQGEVTFVGNIANSSITTVPDAEFDNIIDTDVPIIGTFGGSTTTEREVRHMQNSSGGTLAAGTVVILKSTADGDEITTTTTGGDDKVFGMVLASMSDTRYGPILIEGKTALLKVDGTTDIAVGDFLCTFTTAGIAAKAGAGDMAFAIALEAYTANDSNGVIDALLITPRKL